jgi:hypothetical protein
MTEPLQDPVDEVRKLLQAAPPPDSDTEQMVRETQEAFLDFMDDFKYIPVGKKGEGVLILNYLMPDLARIMATHYVMGKGWRRHPELATVKSRKIVGGLFDDLVAYVPKDQPDDPIVAHHDPLPADYEPKLWSVKPVVNEIFEERPADD